MPEYKDIVYIDWTLVFTIVNAGILFLILKHFLYLPIKKMLSAREQEVKKIYDDAEAASQKAFELKAEYETQISTARDQAGEIVKTATARGQQKYDELLAEAQQKAASTLSRAQAQLEVDRKNAAAALKDEVADLALSAASKVIDKEIDKQAHEKLIEDFINSSENTLA